MEENKIQLEDGLELRVEPSFNFRHSPTEKVEQGYAKVIKKIENFQGLHCLDISFYYNGKLCFSPNDNYYNLQEFEPGISRELKRDLIQPTMNKLADAFTKSIAGNKVRAYEIVDADLVQFDFELEDKDYIRLTRNIKGMKHDVLIRFSEKDSELELIEKCFMRQYPRDRMPDKLLGNVFSVYFVKPGDLEEMKYFERAAVARYNIFGNNLPLIQTSDAALMSLSYGYRMRLIGFDQNILNTEIKKVK